MQHSSAWDALAHGKAYVVERLFVVVLSPERTEETLPHDIVGLEALADATHFYYGCHDCHESLISNAAIFKNDVNK
jgi:hypothetical protein